MTIKDKINFYNQKIESSKLQMVLVDDRIAKSSTSLNRLFKDELANYSMFNLIPMEEKLEFKKSLKEDFEGVVEQKIVWKNQKMSIIGSLKKETLEGRTVSFYDIIKIKQES
jgi:hypothetical protein